MAKGVPSDLAVLESLGKLMLKNDLTFPLAQSLDFASFDLGSLESHDLQRICFGLSKYDVQNPVFSQTLLNEISKRSIFPGLPITIVKWSCFSSEQKVAAFERAYMPSKESDNFPTVIFGSGLRVLKLLSPLHRDLASKVCRSMEILLGTRKKKLEFGTMLSCIEELDRLKLDTKEGVSLRRVLETRFVEKQEKNKYI
jgi:hypothetical protein